MSALDDRIRATLLGLAWGDAFGCPVEGWREYEIAQVYGCYETLPTEYPLERIARLGTKYLRHLRPLGLYSDDAQQALALLNVCLSGPWSCERWADWLADGMARGAWRGYGRNFSGSVAKLRRGVSPHNSGSSTAGIGAVMRIAPLGALYRDQPEKLAAIAWESSLVTHGDIRAGAFAYAVADTAAALIAGQAPEAIRAELPRRVEEQEKHWLADNAEWTIDRTAGQLISRILADFFAAAPTSAEAIRRTVSDLARPHLADGFTKAHPNQGFVLLGGLHALGLALAPVDDPAAALADMVRQGFDTDTVAAIAGALFGARFGTTWIPCDRLLDLPRLQAYADALIQRRGAPEDRATFYQCEAAWTEREERYQVALAAPYK